MMGADLNIDPACEHGQLPAERLAGLAAARQRFVAAAGFQMNAEEMNLLRLAGKQDELGSAPKRVVQRQRCEIRTAAFRQSRAHREPGVLQMTTAAETKVVTGEHETRSVRAIHFLKRDD